MTNILIYPFKNNIYRCFMTNEKKLGCKVFIILFDNKIKEITKNMISMKIDMNNNSYMVMSTTLLFW